MNPITGTRKVSTQRIGEVEVHEVPLLKFDELSRVITNPDNLTWAQLAAAQVRLFARLSDEQINMLTHAETIQICQAGLEVNSAFFPSFVAAMNSTGAEAAARLLAAQGLSPSGNGSTKDAPSPALTPTAPPASASDNSTR